MFKASCKQAKCIYEHSLISASIYKFLRLLKSGGDIPSSVQYKSVYASSDFDKAELFNYYFYSVFTHSSFSLPPIEDIPSPSCTLSSINVSASDVYKTLSTLDPSKAKGFDGIGPNVLKFCALPL